MRQWGWLNHNEPGVERVTLMRSPGTLRGTIAWSSALQYDVHAERSAIKTSVPKATLSPESGLSNVFVDRVSQAI